MTKSRLSVLTLLSVLFAACALSPAPARADARRFAWSYESDTAPAGSLELEQWVTWRHGRDDLPDFDRLEMRHELEWGVTDRLQLGFYLVEWRAEWLGGRRRTQVRSSSLEAIWNLTDPAVSPVGVGLYGEVTLGQDVFALEAKALLEHRSGPWVLVYNAIVEAEWEEAGWVENKGELAQTAGLSLELSPRWLLGMEVVHAVELPDWSGGENATLYAGPTLSRRSGRWFVTTAPLWQLTDSAGSADLQWRSLLGVSF